MVLNYTCRLIEKKISPNSVFPCLSFIRQVQDFFLMVAAVLERWDGSLSGGYVGKRVGRESLVQTLASILSSPSLSESVSLLSQPPSLHSHSVLLETFTSVSVLATVWEEGCATRCSGSFPASALPH